MASHPESAGPTRALVLAAGRGERLRPLTDAMPKPLLPVLGETILSRTLTRLAGAGVEAAAVNLHHLGEQIPRHLGDHVERMPIVYSREETLLGTLGPFGRLRTFFADSDPVLLVNGDSLCDWPIEELLGRHAGSGADATLLLSSRADPSRFGGGVVVDRRGRVLSLRGGATDLEAGRGVFAGFHVVSAELLRNVMARPADIVRDLYEPLIARGARLEAVFTDSLWHDLGTPRRYLEGVLDLAGSSGWIHPEARVSTDALVEGAVVERGATVESGASIERSLVLPGARVGAGARLGGVVVGPGVSVGPEASRVNCLLTMSRSRGLVTTEL